MNPFRQLFGETRLAETVTGLRHLPTAQIATGLRQSIEAFSEGQPLSDDTTIIACKVI
jgi:serine phosphatase RsbU (regulator of sigma subunit)